MPTVFFLLRITTTIAVIKIRYAYNYTANNKRNTSDWID
jgi:hypothetical protein